MTDYPGPYGGSVTGWYDDPDALEAFGTVLSDGRGSLPYLLVHGEALVAAAAWALGESGVTIVDLGTSWEALAGTGLPFVLHDSLCPLTPPDFITSCAERAIETGAVVVGVRPVTDTIKRVDDGFVGETLDREGLLAVCSPVVLPAAVLADLGDLDARPALHSGDLTDLVAELRRRYDVQTVEAPPTAARVNGADDVRLLEALTSRAGQARR